MQPIKEMKFETNFFKKSSYVAFSFSKLSKLSRIIIIMLPQSLEMNLCVRFKFVKTFRALKNLNDPGWAE